MSEEFNIENGVLEKYRGSSSEVVIPEGVTSIGAWAFSGNSSLTSVTIPEGVTSIEYRAFDGCSSLTSITIPEGVTSIGRYAFSGCRSLTSVTIPKGVTSIEDQAFSGCRSLTSVTIPEGVTNIGYCAFDGCSSLTSITIPEGVTSIGRYAFSGCSSLTSITIPEGVTSIGDYAFFRCSSLTGVTIPEGVTSIEDQAFSGCRSLTSVTIPEGVTSIEDQAFSGCRSLTSVTIPEGVTSIGDYAFFRCRSLTSITIPEGVTSIGRHAFSGCSSLTSVTIPEGVTSIGGCAFSGCKGLADQDRMVIINQTIFDYFGKRKNVVIPESVTSIGEAAFSNCSNLISVTISEGVTSIGGAAFSNCSNLISVTIPEGVTSIGWDAFSNCSSLTSITIPEGVTSIGWDAFSNCSSLTSVTIPEGVTSIGGRAFSNCSSLTSVTIPASLTDIGYHIFENCKKLSLLSQVMISYRLVKIDSCVFIKANGEKKTYFAFSSKTESDNISDYVINKKWDRYDSELINNGPKYKYKLYVRLIGALGRLMDPTELNDDNRLQFRNLVKKNIKKMIPLAESMKQPELIEALFELRLVDEQNQKPIRKLIAASVIPEIAAMSDRQIREVKMDTAVAVKPVNTETSVLEKEYEEKLKAIHGDEIIKAMDLTVTTMPPCVLQDQTEAPDALLRFVLASYGSQKRSDGYHIDEEADKAAALLTYDSLLDAIDVLSGHLDGLYYPDIIPLICRFGSSKQVRELIASWKDWGDWRKYNQKGRIAQKKLEDCLILSDTREAVLWLEKRNLLLNYARIRGVSVEDIYEKYLFDTGFNEQGKRIFDLGVTAIEASLTKDLKITLYDTKTGKAVRTIPKKNVDPSIHKVAANELTDLRQNLKKIVKIKNDQLFLDYIEKKAAGASFWKQSYFGNPLLRKIAELLVWAQGDRTFIVTDDGAIDSEGKDYFVSDEDIFVAHPMEMRGDEVQAWQKYFVSNGLKQPFSQIWEPVYQAENIHPDRYKGIPISPKYLRNQKKRGIKAEWISDTYYEAHYLLIDGFYTKEEDATDENRDDWRDQRFQIVSIQPLQWNRRANNVIAFLDRITLFTRIQNDDVSVIDIMDGFTLEQVSNFIKVAMENNATNLLALLMDYKNRHFADFDPMDAFLLED